MHKNYQDIITLSVCSNPYDSAFLDIYELKYKWSKGRVSVSGPLAVLEGSFAGLRKKAHKAAPREINVYRKPSECRLFC
jgi:hypothetical protein